MRYARLGGAPMIVGPTLVFDNENRFSPNYLKPRLAVPKRMNVWGTHCTLPVAFRGPLGAVNMIQYSHTWSPRCVSQLF